LRRDVSERGSVSRSTPEHSKPRPLNVKAFCLAKRLRVTDPRSARITALAGITRLTFISAVTIALTTEQEPFIAGHEGRSLPFRQRRGYPKPRRFSPPTCFLSLFSRAFGLFFSSTI
jgi:hypothetical protein